MTRPLSKLTMAFNRMDGASMNGKPDSFPDLDIWWDPSDPSYRSVTGSVVDSLNNKGSGGAANMLGPAAATPVAAKPTLTTINSIEWMNFVAASLQVIRLPGNNVVYPRGSASCTMVTVFRTTQSTGWVTFMTQGLTGGASPGWVLQVNNSSTPGTMNNPMRDDVVGSVVQTADAIDTDSYDGNTHTIAMVRDNAAGANGELSTYFDGALLGTAASIPASYGGIDETYTTPWTDLMIGARPAGGAAVYQNYVDMSVGDLLIYGSALAAGNVQELHGWLLNKWGS